MQRKNIDKSHERQHEEESESKEIKDDSFDPALPNTEDVRTALSSLSSREESILLSAIEALSIYASKSEDNRRMLVDSDVMSYVLPLLEHEHLFSRRFAGKLLAEIAAVPDVTIFLVQNDYIAYLVQLLTNEKDAFMQEYLSVILAKLSRDPYGNADLANYCSNLEFLFEMMRSADPDIKRNSLEILHNLMQDLVGARKVLKTEGLDLSLLYREFQSPYPEIQQLAFNALADIVARSKDKVAQTLFRETNGVKVLLDFLQNNEWIELHIEALKVLDSATENIVTVNEFINAGGILQILNYAKCATNFFAEAFRIIAHVANTSSGRRILHSHKIIDYLIDALQQSTRSDIVESICYGIGKMAFYKPAAEELVERQFIKTVLDLVRKEDLQWSARYAAVYALRQLLMSDIRNCEIFSDMHGQDYLLQLVQKFIKVPVEVCIIALKVLIFIAGNIKFRDTLVDLDAFETISVLLESDPFMEELKIACCNLLSILCREKLGKQYFLKADGTERLYLLITDVHSIPVRNAAIQLVQTISADLIAAKSFAENKFLSYMLNNRSVSSLIPSWDTCIEMLFKSHLPKKFAFTGRLSENDITKNGFYATRRSKSPFLIVDDVVQLKRFQKDPVYVVNCIQLPISNTSQNKEAFGEKNTFESNSGEEFIGQLQCDSHLVEYLERIKCMILTAESKYVATDAELANVPYVLSRAQMLARFVARQMCGFDREIGCIEHQLEIHLKEIMERLKSSVIPLGQLRVGSYFERALLFKAMADGLCLPVALERGNYGVSWIEIAIPQMEDSDVEQRSKISNVPSKLDKSDPSACDSGYQREKVKDHKSKGFPKKLIRPNFIIDLMDSPGDLIPLGSQRAKLYCTKKLMCDKMCCR